MASSFTQTPGAVDDDDESCRFCECAASVAKSEHCAGYGRCVVWQDEQSC